MFSVLVALGPGGVGCGSSNAGADRPEATLAQSTQAQHEFRELRVRFFATQGGDRAKAIAPLERDLARFIERHGSDASARTARVYLGWTLAERGKLAQARAELRVVRDGPHGSARDLATVGEAMVARLAGQTTAALGLLLPLRDKIVDPEERALFGRELVQAALAERRWSLSVDAMLDWLAQAPAEAQQSLEQQVRQWLSRVPVEALLVALDRLDKGALASSGERSPAREWLRRAIRSALARAAVAKSDSKLARRLLEDAPAAVRAGPEGADLARIAASASIAPRIAGRAVGLVVGIGSAESRRRSAAAAAGMSRAFGAIEKDDGDVRMIVVDDGGEAEGLERGLASLAGEGAALLVAGVEPEGAARAARYAETARIPVIVLADPGKAAEPHHFAFDLSSDTESVGAFGQSELARRAKHAVVVGPGGVGCDAAAPAGQSRFPLQEWKREKVDALVLLGDAGCSADAAREYGAVARGLVVVLGLEAGERWRDLPGPTTVLAVGAGRFPSDVPAAAAGAPTPGWYEALGRDAAELAKTALARLPAGEERDSRAVAELHARAQTALASARVPLWSSEALGFDASGNLPRTLRIVDRSSPGAR